MRAPARSAGAHEELSRAIATVRVPLLPGHVDANRRHRTRAQPRLAMRSVMAAGALLAVVLGAMVVTSRGTDRAPPPHPAKITSGGLEVTVPPDWSRTHRVPALPDFGFTSPIVLVDEAFGTLLVADRLPASSRSLLPAPVLRRLLRSAPRPQPVHLGGALRGFAYMRLAAGDVEGVSDVYVAPTSQGIVTVLCLAK